MKCNLIDVYFAAGACVFIDILTNRGWILYTIQIEESVLSTQKSVIIYIYI